MGGTFLLVSSDRRLGQRFAQAFQEKGSTIRCEMPIRVQAALAQETQHSYQAAICVVESPDDIVGVIRVKKAKPALPIIMLTSIPDPAFRILCGQLGADLVFDLGGDLSWTAGILLRALETPGLGRGIHLSPESAIEFEKDARLISHATRELVAAALGVAAACEPGDFVTLVVEEPGSNSILIARSLREAQISPLLRTVMSAKEAVHFLQGEMEYHNRSKFPLPKLIICDLDLPERSGFELLRFVRGHSSLRTTGFIAYTSTELEEDREEAARLGANFCIPKTSSPELLVEIAKAIFARFVQGRSGLAP